MSPKIPVASLLAAALVITAAACGRQDGEVSPATQHDVRVSVSIVNYMEREGGTEPYPVRIIISKDYVRLDDGYDSSDYVLLDRNTRTLYSVAHENRGVLVIDSQPTGAKMSGDISLTEEHIIDNDAPDIAGKQPVYTRYMANGTTCFEAVSVNGIMPAAVAGLAEFASVLGDRQLASMHTVPETMQTPCFVSRYAYEPARLYSQGLPVQLWDESGFYRSLVDFADDQTVASELFIVPDDYQGLSLQGGP